MIEKTITMSCWSSNEDSTSVVEKDHLCTQCNGKSQEVKRITVKHFVLENLQNKVQEGTYYICLNENCDTVYYESAKNIVFKKEHLRMPIWFKEDANPKYICYCNKVTEDQIIDVVVNNGAKSIKDIVSMTNAMKNANCQVNNPLGKCCSPVIQETIHKGIRIKNEKK